MPVTDDLLEKIAKLMASGLTTQTEPYLKPKKSLLRY
jgi:hypothetical protein